ncbi:OmpA/MotB family protein [Oceanibaculum pacificum]|uniref:OmpA-like domain-containing protein n=1 Tax=Oceanibaculum pacificum TaxID=580166 RepID=A0A154W3E6_9PROT|nr:OmpA family protein [Oceanibaculum pacificum]KZD08122.1 hypothetical protein AUP43_08925 [Oceanibaculum pacificum]
MARDNFALGHENGPSPNAGGEEGPDPFIVLPKVGGPVWLLTFLDMIALVLAFFIMMHAMSTPQSEPFRELSATLADRLNPNKETVAAAPPTALGLNPDRRQAALDLDYLFSVLRTHLDGEPVLARSVLHRLPDRLVISLPSDVLFERNSARLGDSAGRALFALGGVLSNLGNRVDVYGHTDPAPIRAGPYATNWELSLARAQSVAASLLDSGYDKPMTVQGFADTRFARLAGDIDLPRREALARRVDLVIYPTQAAAAP